MKIKSQSFLILLISIIIICAVVVFAVVWVTKDYKDDNNQHYHNHQHQYHHHHPHNGNSRPSNQDIVSTTSQTLTSLPSQPNPKASNSSPDESQDTKDTSRISPTRSYKYAAVASEDEICSEIGNDVLARMRGNAVDSTVATLLCHGVLHPHSSGIGGGAFFIIYDKKHGWHAIDSRETAPAAAIRDMFVKKKDRIKSKVGGLSTAVPGELKGLLEVHQKFGTLPWKALVTPTYNILKKGFRLNKFVQERVVKLKNRAGFEVFLDEQGRPLPVGSLIKDPKLLKTFEIVRDDPMSFYTGDLAKDIAQDIQDAGGIVTHEDMKNYTVEWTNPIKMDLPGGHTLHSMPPPGSGVVLSYILSILSGYNFNAESIATDESRILTYHRIVEAMKFAYGKRSALGDPGFVDIEELVANLTSRSYGEETRKKITDDRTQTLDHYESYFYNKEDHGTNHLSVVDGEGNAVAATTTINLYFGSKVVGGRTGIIFNDIMDDFSTPDVTNAFGVPASAVNFIVPGKRPLSSMTPTIVFDNNKQRVRMVLGAAGGTRITTTTAKQIMDIMWFNTSLAETMDQPRFHHQLMPNWIYVGPHFSKTIREGLKGKGHVVKDKSYISVSHMIVVNDRSVEASSDYRKGGKPAGY